MPNILFYNWVQFDNKKNNGGGVNVYLKNLISEFYNSNDYEIYFLSSGWKYNPLKKYAYVERTNNIYADKIKSFEIINSPIMAPAYTIFNSLEKYLDDDITLKIFIDFIKENGPFDVIHIHNIEGISVNVLKLKEIFPETKIILSIHNYQPICPLNQYFQNHKKCICNDFNNGEECLSCLCAKIDKKEYPRRFANYLLDKMPKSILPLVKFPIKVFSKFFIFKTKDYLNLKKEVNPDIYKKYREYNVQMINKYVDTVLTVSNRVAKILEENGIDKTKIDTLYIGTKFANNAPGHSIAKEKIPFTIAYIGYERIDKGYFFLLDALQQLDKDTANKINVVLAVKNIHSKNVYEKLGHFNNVKIYNGYTNEKLPQILANVNLGIVPVLWEDNLPQVAIEMVACGVPILCSSFGGASELCSSEFFKFEGGNVNAFLIRLKELTQHPEKLEEYWQCHNGLTTMEKHVSELASYYKTVKKVSVIIPVYNVEKYLTQCLDSVCSQTYKNIEIICVNDGSTDNSAKILTDFAQKDSRIKVINKENGGLSSARNAGMKYATGQCYYFLDSDDYIEPDLIENAVDNIIKFNVDYVCFGSQPEGNLKLQSFEGEYQCIIAHEGVVELNDYVLKTTNINVWNKLFRAEIIKKHDLHFLDGLLYEDIFFVWSYFFLSQKAFYDNKIYHHYRLREDSIMSETYKNKSLKALDHIKNWQKLVEFCSNNKDIFKKSYKILKYLLSFYCGLCEKLLPLENTEKIYKLQKEYKTRLKLEKIKNTVRRICAK